jgi:hypothetical protein
LLEIMEAASAQKKNLLAKAESQLRRGHEEETRPEEGSEKNAVSEISIRENSSSPDRAAGEGGREEGETKENGEGGPEGEGGEGRAETDEPEMIQLELFID